MRSGTDNSDIPSGLFHLCRFICSWRNHDNDIFLKFGIRRIIAVRTGYEARKEIRRIEEENRKKETKTSDVFVLKKNVMMVHTNEVIERDGGRS